MEATTTGANRTGTAMSPLATRAMTEASDELTPMTTIDTTLAKAERTRYIAEADAIGSIPPPLTLTGVMKTGIAKATGGEPTLFLDKLGERLAFERAGTRLYDALLVKFEALAAYEAGTLPNAEDVLQQSPDLAATQAPEDELPVSTVRRIRNEELAHFRLVAEAIETMGGDPTAQTPCANVIATASMGFLQVITDPRTTLAQCLNTMVTVELTDNAGWELLTDLANEEGQSELAGHFRDALSVEQQHLVIVKGWLSALLKNGVGTPTV